jgi:hypothetical protein
VPSARSEELINKAAAILGKYVPGEALGDVEHATIDRCIDDVLAEVGKIVAITDRDKSPTSFRDHGAHRRDLRGGGVLQPAARSRRRRSSTRCGCAT